MAHVATQVTQEIGRTCRDTGFEMHLTNPVLREQANKYHQQA
jgi:tRNA(Leu) C34 or U34 (ribose-2'-O)-methylase TrmL